MVRDGGRVRLVAMLTEHFFGNLLFFNKQGLFEFLRKFSSLISLPRLKAVALVVYEIPC